MTGTQGCPYNQTDCPDGSGCIPDHRFCNMFIDCDDGSDEFNCGNYTKWGDMKAVDRFGWSGCIPDHWFCNVFVDCDDGSDEFNCGNCTKWGICEQSMDKTQ